MAHLLKKKGLGNFSILFLTQCTVMIFAGKGDILTKPVRRGKGICLFFGRKFDFGKEKRGEITGEDIKLDREMIFVRDAVAFFCDNAPICLFEQMAVGFLGNAFSSESCRQPSSGDAHRIPSSAADCIPPAPSVLWICRSGCSHQHLCGHGQPVRCIDKPAQVCGADKLQGDSEAYESDICVQFPWESPPYTFINSIAEFFGGDKAESCHFCRLLLQWGTSGKRKDGQDYE